MVQPETPKEILTKTFENEGWSLLKIQTLTDTAKCYEKLNDTEKLVRTCAQLSCASEFVIPQQRLEYCEKLMDFAKNRLEQMTTVDADDLLTVKQLSMSSKVTSELDKITPGSEIELYLQIESHFPIGNLKFEYFIGLFFHQVSP